MDGHSPAPPPPRAPRRARGGRGLNTWTRWRVPGNDWKKIGSSNILRGDKWNFNSLSYWIRGRLEDKHFSVIKFKSQINVFTKFPGANYQKSAEEESVHAYVKWVVVECSAADIDRSWRFVSSRCLSKGSVRLIPSWHGGHAFHWHQRVQ